MAVRVVSLFSGCGGLDLGFTRAGFEIVLALDVDPVAVKTYNFNRKEEIAKVADLSEASGESIIELLEGMHTQEPIRGLIGGPPCQPFSRGNVSGSRDAAQYELPRAYGRILATLNAHFDLDFFVFENVHGITYEKHRKEFGYFSGLFKKAGFRIFEGLLDALDFGVAQRRPRVFVVGWNEKKYGDWDFIFPRADGSPRLLVEDVIGGLPEPRFFERGLKPADIPFHPNHWTMQPKSRKFQNGFLAQGYSNGRSFRVLSWKAPSGTVAYGNREIHIHPSGKRRLSVYEAMKLQGFPETYQLLGTLSDQIRQVSDAVPPPLAEALAMAVARFLSGDKESRVPTKQRILL